VENRLRRFLDLQAGSIWRDLRLELAGLQGTLLDIGCGAQVYRMLLPPGVVYTGIDSTDAQARFGYATPQTQYFLPMTTGAWPRAVSIRPCAPRCWSTCQTPPGFCAVPAAACGRVGGW
jgi:hypothetical protein